MPKHPALKDRPLVFVDVETTGLDPHKHEILEVAAVLAYPDGDTPSFYEAKIKPERIEDAHPKALEVNGYTEEAWASARPLSMVLPELVAFMEGAVIGGQNTRFDVGFINASIKRLSMDLRIDYHLVDVATLAYEHLVPLGLGSLSLFNICKFIGIPPEPRVHQALNGAERARDVYYALHQATWVDRFRWKLANSKG